MPRRPSRPLLPAALALLLAVACDATPSPVADDAEIHITGRLVSQGQPVADAEVSIVAGSGPSDFLGMLPGVGIVCLGGACAGVDEKLRSDEDGRVELTTTGLRTKTLAGNARTIALTAYDPGRVPEGAIGRGGSLQVFKVLQETVDLPPLELWRTPLSVERRGTKFFLRFTPSAMAGASYAWRVDDLQGNPLVDVTSLPADRSVDARLLEDFPGRMAVSARADTQLADVVARSAVYPLVGSLVPPSRGAACRRRDRDGRATLFRDCGLTDGNLRTIGPAAIGDCVDVLLSQRSVCHDRVDPVDIVLPKSRDVSLVVIRSASTIPTVLTSPDGTTWTVLNPDRPAPSVGQRHTVVVAGSAAGVRYVRVQGAPGVTEVAVW